MWWLWLLVPGASAGKKAQQRYEAARAMAEAAADQAFVQGVAQARAAAEAAGDSPGAVWAWAAAVQVGVEAGAHGRGALTDADLDQMIAAVEAATGDEIAVGSALGAAAAAALGADRPDQAAELADRALDVYPTSAALNAWLGTHEGADGAERCRGTLAAASSDIQRYDVLTACNAAVGSDWASDDDQDWLAAETQRRQASQAAHTARLQAESAAMAAQMAASRPAPAPATGGASPASGPQRVSVSLHIDCDQRVRLFQGASRTSGGTYGWNSPNTVRSVSMNAGEVLCICDDRDNKQSCWTAAPISGRLEVGCGGFSVR